MPTELASPFQNYVEHASGTLNEEVFERLYRSTFDIGLPIDELYEEPKLSRKELNNKCYEEMQNVS